MDSARRAGAPPHAAAPRWRRIAWRAASVAAVALMLAGGGGWLWRAGIPASIYAQVTGRLLTASADAGYRLRQVIVEGRKNTPREVLLGSLGVHMGQPLLAIDLPAAQARLEELPWVKTAEIERLLPDTIFVRLAERHPLAFFQHQGKLALVTDDGKIIQSDKLDEYGALIVLVGDDAPLHTADLLDMLAREPDLAGRMSRRRCGSARGAGTCISTTASTSSCPRRIAAERPGTVSPQLERQRGLLARDVVAVDLRLPDRLVLRLPPEPPKPAAGQESDTGGQRRHDASKLLPHRRGADGRRPGCGHHQGLLLHRPARRGRPRIVGIGHQISRGVKNGVIVDIEAASHSIATAVNAAEQMAGEQITEAVVNISGAIGASRLVKAEIAVNGRDIGDHDMRRVLELGYRVKEPSDRTVIHSVPVGFSIDGSRGIRDPRGMFGHKLAVNMNIVTAAAAGLRNLASCIGRCHLEIAALVVSPYAAGLAALVEDETKIGVTLIDMGGGTTTVSVFYDGNLVFADSIPIGGNHVTNDIVRGLSTPLAHAERMKTLYGNCVASPADEREMITVPQIGEEDDGQANNVPKSLLVGIIAPRIEETFELARDRLESSGFDKLVGRRIVLTGGASQLPGVRELAGIILDKQIRIGRPLRINGLAEATNGPAFAVGRPLIAMPSVASREPRPSRMHADAPNGLIGRLGNWLKENF